MVPSTANSPAHRVVVVLGMHRSGTSLVAGCLQRLGVDFGPRLMPPNADNPRGYFEHNDVVNLHDRLLLALDRSWDDPSALPSGWWQDEETLATYRERLVAILQRDFADSSLWGLKDPRLCRLLPWWEAIWPLVGVQPLFVLVRRAPLEVAASLARRDGMSSPRAALLWLRHVIEAEKSTRAHERIFVEFADFLQDETAAMEPVRLALGLPPSPKSSSSQVVDRTLGRPVPETQARDLPLWVQSADAVLGKGSSGEEAAMRTRLDRLAEQLAAAEPFLSSPATTDLHHQLLASRKQARWYEQEWRKAQGRVARLETRLSRGEPPKKHGRNKLSQK